MPLPAFKPNFPTDPTTSPFTKNTSPRTTTKPQLSIRDAFSYGWNTLKTNLSYLVTITLVLGISIFIPRVVRNLFESNNLQALHTITKVIVWFLVPFLNLGYTILILGLINKKPLPPTKIFSSNFKLYLKYLISSLAFTAVTIIGYLIFIIPGIILSARLQFFKYFLIEQNATPLQSFKLSWNATKKVTLKLILFGIISSILNLFGTTAVFLGLLITTPLTILAQVFLYRTLSARKK